MPRATQRRHLNVWPFGVSGPSPSSLPTSSAGTASPAANGAWSEDPWSGEPKGLANSTEDAFVRPASELSSSASPISDITQQAASAPVASVSPPINPLTNLPLDGNHVGDMTDLGLGGWGPVGLAQNLLEQIHVYTGMPWWGTIVTVSVVTRILLWPVMLKGMGRGARFFDIKDEVETLMKNAQSLGPEEKIRASLQARELMKKHDASPFGTLPPMLAQAAIVFTVFLAIQGMAHLPLESLKTGGMAWFENLTVPDSTYYLPGIASLVFLAGLEASEIPDDPNAARGKNIGRVLLIAGFFILKSMPAGVVLFIGTNGVLQVVQGLFLRVPGVRQRLRIPLARPTKAPSDQTRS